MMSVVAFIVTSMLLSFLSGLMMILFGISIDSFSNMTESMSNSQAIMFIMNVTFLGSIVYSFIELAVFFFGTERILSKHLNLE